MDRIRCVRCPIWRHRECHLPGGGGIAHLYAQSGLWNPTPCERLDSLLLWSCRRAGVGLLIAPQLSCHVLEFTPVNERVTSLRLQVGHRSLTVLSAYGPNSYVEYLAFLESGWGTGGCSNRGLCCSTGGLQRSRGQRQCYLEGCDWEKQPPRSEPGRPKPIVRVCWESLAEPSIREVFNSLLRESFYHPREAGDIEAEWNMFSSSIVD